MLYKSQELPEPSFLHWRMGDMDHTYYFIKSQHLQGSKGVISYTLFLNVQKQQTVAPFLCNWSVLTKELLPSSPSVQAS